MKRKIIKIDEKRCNGCGLCAEACHEGAIKMVDGKAKLIRDDYCDGLGDCLPVCPTDAISFEEREAAAYDAEAVAQNMKADAHGHGGGHGHGHGGGHGGEGGCPGMKAHAIAGRSMGAAGGAAAVPSMLAQWPVQIKLAPVNAPYFSGANLLIAADCTAFSYGNFHADFMKDHVTLIGCPKLDEGDYTEKLTTILSANDIKSVTVARMEVPCCGGIANAAREAVAASGKNIPLKIAVISTDGNII